MHLCKVACIFARYSFAILIAAHGTCASVHMCKTEDQFGKLACILSVLSPGLQPLLTHSSQFVSSEVVSRSARALDLRVATALPAPIEDRRLHGVEASRVCVFSYLQHP